MDTTELPSGRVRYSEGDYSLCVHASGTMFPYHRCDRSCSDDVYFDILLNSEFLRGHCNYCGKLDIPESLQALYILYQYGCNNG